MYFDKFEEELASVVRDPDSDSYDQEPQDDIPVEEI